jgi:hypothetical protein
MVTKPIKDGDDGRSSPSFLTKKQKKPFVPSEEQILVRIQMLELGLPECVFEYRFHESRDWQFDAAIPEIHLAIEIEGGIHPFRNQRTGQMIVGRHSRGAGYQEDLDKYNAATARAWRVFRFSVADVQFARSKTALAEWLEFAILSNNR